MRILHTLAVVLVEHVYFFELTGPQQLPLLTFEMNLAIPHHCSSPPAAIRGSHPEVGEPYGRLARSRGGDVLGELDDQPLGTADVDEPIDVRVVLDLADRVEPV